MAELQDALLDGEFAAYRDTLLAAVHPSGPAAARETVRRRRRRAVVTVAAVTLVAAAIPVAGWAALGPDAGPPVAPAETTSPTPSPTNPPTASARPTPSGTPPAPDGRISRTELLSSPVELPAWPRVAPATCITKPARLLPASTPEFRPSLLGLRYGDVDADDASETVALVGCQLGEAAAKQVVVFDRDTTGRIITLGGVVRTHEGFDDITETAVGTDGTVRVRVADIQPCCGEPVHGVRRQWRGYRWDRGRFVQSAGPVAFPSTSPTSSTPATTAPVEVSLTITATKLVYGPPDADGVRWGTTTVTVVNRGNGTVEYPMIIFPENGRDEAVHAEWAGCPRVEGRPDAITCISTPLRPGERRSIDFPFLTTSSGPGGEATVKVAAGTGEGQTLIPGTTAVSTTFPVAFG